jgi:hypothetical protein
MGSGRGGSSTRAQAGARAGHAVGDMIVFRQVDARYPFLWEDPSQPAGRFHAQGEGPAHYFADTPDGAWAEFLRHEEITDVEDLVTIRRQIWAVDIGDEPIERMTAAKTTLVGGRESYERCQQEARVRRDRGVRRIAAPSAALVAKGARGFRVQNGMHVAAPRDGLTIVIFGASDDLVGWVAAEDGHPRADLLKRVRHFESAYFSPRTTLRQLTRKAGARPCVGVHERAHRHGMR